MTPIIQLNNVHFQIKPHFWSRSFEILKGVSMQVPKGSLYGFLGPNGAGKTTTLKTILGLLQPTKGHISIMEGSIKDPVIRQKIGFTPEHPVFPEHLSGQEFVLQHALLAGLSRKEAAVAVDKALEEVNLRDASRRKIRTYSKGMLQRTGLAQALIGKPQLVLFDEPMGGVDPVGRREIREIMLRLKEKGTTVLFSTHILPDVEMICDYVGILVNGEIKKTGTPEELRSELQNKIELVALFDEKQSIDMLQTPHSIQGQQVVFHVESSKKANELIDKCRGLNATIHSVVPLSPSLEDLFITEYKNMQEGAENA